MCNEIIQSSNMTPSARGGCTLNYYNEYLYLFGGYIQNFGHTNDLFIYSLKRNEWKRIDSNCKPNKVKYHRSIIYGKYLIVFGGLARYKHNWICYNDINLFDLQCNYNEWNIINTSEVYKPKKRYKHGMCILNDYLIIYGGMDVNDNILNDCYYINIKNTINNNDNNSILNKWINIDLGLNSLSSHLMLNHSNKFSHNISIHH